MASIWEPTPEKYQLAVHSLQQEHGANLLQNIVELTIHPVNDVIASSAEIVSAQIVQPCEYVEQSAMEDSIYCLGLGMTLGWMITEAAWKNNQLYRARVFGKEGSGVQIKPSGKLMTQEETALCALKLFHDRGSDGLRAIGQMPHSWVRTIEEDLANDRLYRECVTLGAGFVVDRVIERQQRNFVFPDATKRAAQLN